MCGIAGIVDMEREQKTTVLEAMQRTLRRRGPDQEGIYIDKSISLIHTRLSVVDLENGEQPMVLEQSMDHEQRNPHVQGNEKYTLVYNGELYNTSELRQELECMGHKFYGHSDTEVLLHAYIQWKESCVERLNGIFAFAIWEKHKSRLFIARDRIGVKPFFYTVKNNIFLFASEIKTLLAHPMVEPMIDAGSIAEIILIGPGRTPGCGVFKGIEELLPGYWGFYDNKGLRLQRYWSLQDREHTDTFDQTVEKVRALIIDSIERQLVSDVPLGTFLSGGLDSSIISSVVNRYFQERGKELHTFSVDYRDNEQYFQTSKFQPNSDAMYIQEMNRYLGAKHHRVLLEIDDLVGALYTAVDARDLPGMADVDSSLLLFSKEVKERVTVALSGECADEIFGGYPWYRDKNIREREGFPWAQSTGYRMSFLKSEFSTAIDALSYVDTRYRKTVAETSVLPGTTDLERRMKEMVNLNFQWFMQTLLDRKDRMSMYSGLEVRVPYCDYRIAEYLYTVPWEMKDYQGREKGLLRIAVEGLLPQEILWRKKSPYPKTHHPAYMQAVSKQLREIIADPSAPILTMLAKEPLEALIRAGEIASTGGINSQGGTNSTWYGQLMGTPQTIAYFLQLNYWMDQYKVKII